MTDPHLWTAAFFCCGGGAAPLEAMDAIVKTLEEEAAEELYLDSVHEATNASHNDGTAFGEVEAITNWAAANLPTDDDEDL